MRPTVTLLAFLLAPAPAVGQEPTDYDRFRLFTGCMSLEISVGVEDDENDLGLSEERLETAVRSRLRGARVFYTGPTGEALDAVSDDDRDSAWAVAMLRLINTPVLSVWVHVVGSAFSVDARFRQRVKTISAQLFGTATTWNSGTTGTHGQDPSYVLGVVAEAMDSFIDDYLRINEEACSN